MKEEDLDAVKDMVEQEFDILVDSDWFITHVNELVDKRLQDVVRAIEVGIETITKEKNL
tara:strand:+ start:738 stop:914 length:177 start_codon:yes stop_codon:yes gene_type:complete